MPTVKISSNSRLFESKPGWIDFDAGALLSGKSLEQLSVELFDYVLSVASGERTRNEINGYKEISIFKDGIIL